MHFRRDQWHHTARCAGKLPFSSCSHCHWAAAATTYVPISWYSGDKVRGFSRSDPTLAILFDRYDPERKTLSGSGESFDEVMMPSEVEHHLGAYRQDTKLIYRNLYLEYSDRELRDLMVHEFSHHIWYTAMSQKQREEWGEHLNHNPSPLQTMVRHVYQNPAEYGTEDFAFTVEYARPVDIRELAQLQLITDEECDTMLAELKPPSQPAALMGGAATAAARPEWAQTTLSTAEKGINPAK